MIAFRKLERMVVLGALASGIALAGAFHAGMARADTVALKADLEPSSEVPPRVSHGHGMLNATFDTTTQSLQWTITYEGLGSAATAAHFHGPAPVGQNAKIQIPIQKGALASPITGTAQLTEQQVTDLMAGQWYFNIHTVQNPMGEIRGQILPSN
ncbi:CHRD domain-containing protein [Paraburkholderia sp. DHOC27]|uniref:CHRD domain-containing protein n=1 Tax=Paraburkholderia sp. DHOC27 TaxID=2303330 RepID=UPI000E3D2B23|nr:CHRD domain-containing protein [Paraburkholderia sp. DHOC27]RFU47036.1 CHRD domain-containing protein [Paraburkholderia sp. DHOC27]